MDSGSSYFSSEVPPNDAGRIPKNAAEGTLIFLYVLALLAATLRTFIRARYQKLQYLDDGFLLTAIIFMTIAFGIFWGFVDDLYITEALIYDTLAALEEAGDNIVAIGERVQIYTIPYIILSISGIFAVKFSFLFFFKNILSRIQPLVLYWNGVVAFTAVSWVFSVGFSVYGCPYTDQRALNCAQGPEFMRALDTSIVLIVFDICTDLLVISIPVIVLKQIKLPWKKKLYLAASLCLSAVMVVVALFQAVTITYEGLPDIDVVWEVYFQFVELTLAVMVVSATAFRAFFVQRNSQSGSGDSPRSPSWSKYKTYKKVWQKIWPSTSTEESDAPQVDAQIPRATMTGMRTMIDRAAGSPWPDSGSEEHQLGNLEPPPRAARKEPAGYTMASLISPDEEYHRIQRGLQGAQAAYRRSEATETLEVGGEPSPAAVTPMSISDLGSDYEETDRPSPISPAPRRRSKIGISRGPTDPKLVVPSNSPMPDHMVSPIESQDYQIPSSGMPSRPSEPQSRRQSRVLNVVLDHSLPPTPPQTSRPPMATFLDNTTPSRSDEEQEQEPQPEPSRAEAEAQQPRQSAVRRALAPGGGEEMRESGLKRAIQSSFDMASDMRPRNTESWFFDE